MNAVDVGQGIDAALTRIEAAHAELSARRPVDLAGLEAEADRLCNALLQLPAGEAKPFAPRLAAMIEALDRVATALRSANAAAAAAPDPRRVPRAYGGSRG